MPGMSKGQVALPWLAILATQPWVPTSGVQEPVPLTNSGKGVGEQANWVKQYKKICKISKQCSNVTKELFELAPRPHTALKDSCAINLHQSLLLI